MGFLKDILDLAVLREESKKRHIDTKLAEAALEDKERLIVRASMDDVERFDPKVRQLNQQNRNHQAGCSVVLLIPLALLAVLVFGVL